MAEAKTDGTGSSKSAAEQTALAADLSEARSSWESATAEVAAQDAALSAISKEHATVTSELRKKKSRNSSKRRSTRPSPATADSISVLPPEAQQRLDEASAKLRADAAAAIQEAESKTSAHLTMMREGFEVKDKHAQDKHAAAMNALAAEEVTFSKQVAESKRAVAAAQAASTAKPPAGDVATALARAAISTGTKQDRFDALASEGADALMSASFAASSKPIPSLTAGSALTTTAVRSRTTPLARKSVNLGARKSLSKGKAARRSSNARNAGGRGSRGSASTAAGGDSYDFDDDADAADADTLKSTVTATARAPATRTRGRKQREAGHGRFGVRRTDASSTRPPASSPAPTGAAGTALAADDDLFNAIMM